MKLIKPLALLLLFISCGNKEKHTTEIILEESQQSKPNIIIFYVDDLGYGDLSCYGAKAVVTPNVDKLAAKGIKFTDAHSSAATCTPSRYSLLTGEYAFRKRATILPGDAPLLIDPSVPTLPKMLQKSGYKTAVVGKWHLGLGNGNVNWNEVIKPGPLEIGFDYSFLLPATGDRVPTVYVENHRALNLDPLDQLKVSYKVPFKKEPLGTTHQHLLRQQADMEHSQAIVNGISRIGYQTGGKSALWKDEDFAEVFTDKAKTFINSNRDNPFFLFFSFHDIHVPRLPHEKFQGKTKMGPRGDAIVQMDWMTGAIMSELTRLGIEKNTLVIFTSDNGPVLNDGYEDNAIELLGDHSPSGPYRGGKYSAFEAGTRVPMIAYWPEKIKRGESDALISQIDLYATFGNLTGAQLESHEAIDSQNMLPALLHTYKSGRDVLIEESFTLSLRMNDYKYIAPMKASKKEPLWMLNKKIELGFSHQPQLFDLSDDPSEQENIAKLKPDILLEMKAKIDSVIHIK